MPFTPSAHLRRNSVRLVNIFIALGLQAPLFTTEATGQSVLRDRPGGVCVDCVRLVRELTIGDSTDIGAVVTGRGLVRDSKGRYLHARGDEIAVFGPKGDYQQTLGRAGAGPLEFRRIQIIALADGDTLHVWDPANARHSVFSPAFSLVRTGPAMGRNMSVIGLPSGEMVLNAHVPVSGTLGIPFHLLDAATGKTIKSFGLREGEFYDANIPWAGWRELAPARGRTFWAARRNEYRLELWSGDGELRQEYIRQVPWFPKNEASQPLAPGSPPKANIEAIHRDETDRLWIFITVPDPNWESHLKVQGEDANRKWYRPTHLSGVYDTIIEVVDLRLGQVVASQRFGDYLWGFLGRDVVFGDGETADGPPRFTIYRLQGALKP